MDLGTDKILFERRGKIARVRRRFEAEKGREPTNEELAKATPAQRRPKKVSDPAATEDPEPSV